MTAYADLTEEQKQRIRERRKIRYRAMTAEERKKASEAASAWQKANPDRAARTAKLYRIRHSDSIASRLSEEQRAKRDERTIAWHKERPWYRNWQSAKSRCNRPSDISYQFYGARGIKCELSKFDVQFLWARDNAASMRRPSLDRIDPEKNYTLDNCRFIEKDLNSKLGAIASKARQAQKDARATLFLSAADIQAMSDDPKRHSPDILGNPLSAQSGK